LQIDKLVLVGDGGQVRQVLGQRDRLGRELFFLFGILLFLSHIKLPRHDQIEDGNAFLHLPLFSRNGLGRGFLSSLFSVSRLRAILFVVLPGSGGPISGLLGVLSRLLWPTAESHRLGGLFGQVQPRTPSSQHSSVVGLARFSVDEAARLEGEGLVRA